jgi:Uma2 family endonuclease
MATASVKERPSATWSMARLRKHLGMIPAERILTFPYPGQATAKELLDLDDHYDVICELFDGVLVRKPTGIEEAYLAAFIIHQLMLYLDKHDLGLVVGEAGFIELAPRQIRAPDVSFFSWARLPNSELPKKRFLRLVPDLAVEILSHGNTPKEMARKRCECFAQGTQLVWQVDPVKRTVEVFTSPTASTTLILGQTLDGGRVLPGFKLKLGKLFAPRHKRG